MNVLLICQCDKRALVETRRILDQFAERRGDRTWQTPITQDGLDTLRRLLRKSARKNTAVACHWIRGLDHSELLWIVGDRRRFNAEGAVPTNTTARDVLRHADENDWQTGEAIHLLTAMAALLHDLGKACQAFQDRLRGKYAMVRNDYRHEWVSLRMFQSFVGSDGDASWLARLIEPTPADDASWTSRLVRDGLDTPALPPFAALAHAPLAQAIGWLVVTHHRLPQCPDETFNSSHLRGVLQRVTAPWNEQPAQTDGTAIAPYWTFAFDQLPVFCPEWRRRAATIARRLQGLTASSGAGDWLANPYVMHVSRLCLMLADHHYSSLQTIQEGRCKVDAFGSLYANTRAASSQAQPREPMQPLNEHLIGVARHGQLVTHALPKFELHLPFLGHGHRPLRQRASHDAFRWQDKSADLAISRRAEAAEHGAFIVNMASTGCGKTLANAKIMRGLSDPTRGMRCSFATGLRTLTLQTGGAFRRLLQLDEDQLAVLVGGAASRALFQHFEKEAEVTGSASQQALLEEFAVVDGAEGNEDAHPLLSRVVRDSKARRLLIAPLLVCTVDHLTPATESQRGGRQIVPMLRLMSSDLVLDEPDDFDLGDLPALGRLVHWAGLLGSRVLLSSATLAPALVQSLFDAYLAGRREYARNRGRQLGHGASPAVCCMWFDEYEQQHAPCASSTAFMQSHQPFAARRAGRLATAQEVRRRAMLIPLDMQGSRGAASRHQMFAKVALDAALKLHARHREEDPHSGKRVSFGLVRMANIEPLVEVALALFRAGAPAGFHVHLCVYHARFPLLLRSAIERRIDAALDRRDPDAVYSIPDVRQRIDAHDAADHLFIVLGSPVTEVGRDHDYDWAVVEPSSMRSLIQLAGRVRRHRSGECPQPNISVFDTNLRHLRRPDGPAFEKPGFEDANEFLLVSHRLTDILRPCERDVIDARPRIQSLPVEQLQPRQFLVDLEHARLRGVMLPGDASEAAPTRSGLRQRQAVPTVPLNAASWWQSLPKDALLTHALPQFQAFRRRTLPEEDFLLLLNEDQDGIELHLALQRAKEGPQSVNVTLERLRMLDDALVQGVGMTAWGEVSYLDAVSGLAGRLGIDPKTCAERFGGVTLSANEGGRMRFHPVLGFTNASAPAT